MPKLFGFILTIISVWVLINCSSNNEQPEGADARCGQIEYRLTKLEVQVAEKSENLRAELREGNRRLLAVENQEAEVQTILEGFRNELARFIETIQVAPQPTRQIPGEVESRIDNLAKGLQVVVSVLRGHNQDVQWVRKNVPVMINTTNQLLRANNQLVTKQFLTNSLLELKHHQIYHPQLYSVSSPPKTTPTSCKDIQDGNPSKPTGIYWIQPATSSKGFMVVCDMTTTGGGWTLIQNRFDGSQDFFLDYHDYKNGFGNLGGEFWLGLEQIHQLTGSDVHELLIELTDTNQSSAYALYSAFSLGSETEGYSLKILAGYSGDAGDSLSYHAGNRFSTRDMDQDSWVEGSCAQSHGGAWWYRSCDTCNLNGKYLNGELPESHLYQGMYWGEFRGAQYSLSKARMMIRPRNADSPPLFPNGIGGKAV